MGCKNLGIVIRLSCFLEFGQKIDPFCSNFVKNFCENFESSVLMNFNVNFTVNRGVSDRLPATVFVAAVNVSIFFFILTEVQPFSRMNLGADSLDKVLVINDAVPIRVK